MNQNPSNQPIKFFFPNGQSPQFLPQQFPMDSSPAPQMPMLRPMGPNQLPQPGQPNVPYYCTYIPAPGNYQQQQQYPYMPTIADLQRQFIGSSRTDISSMAEGSEQNRGEQRQQTSESKSTYDESDEKYYPSGESFPHA